MGWHRCLGSQECSWKYETTETVQDQLVWKQARECCDQEDQAQSSKDPQVSGAVLKDVQQKLLQFHVSAFPSEVW